jgi:hypothetical protein
VTSLSHWQQNVAALRTWMGASRKSCECKSTAEALAFSYWFIISYSFSFFLYAWEFFMCCPAMWIVNRWVFLYSYKYSWGFFSLFFLQDSQVILKLLGTSRSCF